MSNTVLRLCHVCNYINEAEKEVIRCGKCSKAFLPMTSLEKIILATAQAQTLASNDRNVEELSMNYMLIQGLMVIW